MGIWPTIFGNEAIPLPTSLTVRAVITGASASALVRVRAMLGTASTPPRSRTMLLPGAKSTVVAPAVSDTPAPSTTSTVFTATTVGGAVKPLKMIGHIGLALLLLSGLTQATMAGAWTDGGVWFWIKILAVIGLVAGIVVAGKTGKRAMAGDAEAAGRMPALSALNLLLGVTIIVAAVMTFH